MLQAELNAPQDVITCQKDSISVLARVRSVFRSASKAKAAQPERDCIEMAPWVFALVSSIFTVGGLVGALLAGPLSSRHGRLPTMRLTAGLFLVGSAAESLSSSAAVLAGGRFVAGLGAGASTVVVPVYISEIAPRSQRGGWGYATQVGVNVGILLTQTCGFFWSRGSQWRWILRGGVVAALVQGIAALVVLPESPEWLKAHGGEKGKAKGWRIEARIRGRSGGLGEESGADDGWSAVAEDGSSVGAGRPEEQGLLNAEGGSTTSVPKSAASSSSSVGHLGFVQVLRDPLYRPAIIAVVGIMFAQQLCGINSIIMYSVSLLADLLPVSSALLTILISVVNLFMTLACAPLPDRLGRKTCLLISIVGQGASSLALAVSIVTGLKILSALAVLLFVAFFAVGLGPVPFILASELVGQEAVGATQSWCLAANYTATFLVAQFFPIINQALNDWLGGPGGWAFFVFAALAAASTAFVAWNVPETKGKKNADEVWGRTRRID